MPGRPGRSGLDNAISGADELKAVLLSIQRYLRFLLDNPPTCLDHLYAVKNLVENLADNIVQECNKVFPNWKMTTKRQPSLIQGSNGLHLPKVKQQFQGVRGVHKKRIGKRIVFSARKQRKVQYTSDPLQHSVRCNIVEEAGSDKPPVQLFKDFNM